MTGNDQHEYETDGPEDEAGGDPMAEEADDIVAAYEAEIAELNERLLRLAAELENTRRRGEREKQDASRYAIAGFARDLLSVADTFERALAAAPGEGEDASPETVSSLIAGLKMTDKELQAILERHGVRRLAPRGEKFDPHYHQAVAQAPGAAPAGHVLDVVQPGFVIGERVLRAAMVVVSTGPASGAPPEDPPVGGRLDTRV